MATNLHKWLYGIGGLALGEIDSEQRLKNAYEQGYEQGHKDAQHEVTFEIHHQTPVKYRKYRISDLIKESKQELKREKNKVIKEGRANDAIEIDKDIQHIDDIADLYNKYSIICIMIWLIILILVMMAIVWCIWV